VYKPNDEPAPSTPTATNALIVQGIPKRSRLIAMIGLSLIILAGVLLPESRGALAGITSQAGDRTAPAQARSAPTKSAGAYQLRCWQYGQLLFDEGPVTLSSEARSNARLVATDRNGAALIVTDAGGTTCLARPAAAPANLALPR
jgi:hypothetical protein